MIRGNQPKHKICRKAGFCLWANPKCPASRGKTHFAGEQGRKNYRRSDYYRMLFEKQGVLAGFFPRTSISKREEVGDVAQAPMPIRKKLLFRNFVAKY